MEPEIKESSEGRIVSFEGDLYEQNEVDAVHRALTATDEGIPKAVVLDMSKVQVLSGYGIKRLLDAHRELKSKNTSLALKSIKGVPETIVKALHIDKFITLR